MAPSTGRLALAGVLALATRCHALVLGGLGDVVYETDDRVEALESNASYVQLVGSSVVRILAVSGAVNTMRPYDLADDESGVGSGWIVKTGRDDELTDPVFITNAHVVTDARYVSIQMPSLLGKKEFEAYCPILCEDFDLAIVKLRKPAEFQKAIAKVGGSLKSLRLNLEPLSLTTEVLTAGFPLGSDTVKLSRGIISGTEDQLPKSMAYQCTAPISPGNSGGPLFALDQVSGRELQVIGVSFATSAEENSQNINFLVPTMLVSKVLKRYHELLSTGKLKHHVQYRIPDLDATLVEASDALYRTSGKCQQGVFISEIGPKSPLRTARPAVPERSFLFEANNIELDNTGMGRTEHMLGDPMTLETLINWNSESSAPVTLKVCKNGVVTSHEMSMEYLPEHELGIPDIPEVYFSDLAKDYEAFAGITVMQMYDKHLDEIQNTDDDLKEMVVAPQGRWQNMRYRYEPRVLVSSVEEGTYANRVLTEGMVVESINGAKVRTMADFRANFVPKGEAWRLETDRGMVFIVNFKEEVMSGYENAMNGMSYLLTPLLRRAVQMYTKIPTEAGTAAGPVAEKAEAKETVSVKTLMEIAEHGGSKTARDLRQKRQARSRRPRAAAAGERPLANRL